MKSNKKQLLNKFIGLLLLVIAYSVIFVCLSGGHFEDFGETIIVMLLVSLVMMAVPTGAWLMNHKHLNRKKGLKICVVNSLAIYIVTIFWPILTIIKNEPCNPSNTVCEVQLSWEILVVTLFLTILYSLINICFWVDLRRTK
jgi:hypothetical protein